MFTSDHVRCLAVWCERLGLAAHQQALFALYHEMTVTRMYNTEKVTALSMDAIQAIQLKEDDRGMFYRTMRAWGVMD